MATLCTTHHTLTVESWNGTGVHVLDLDTQQVRLLLRDETEINAFVSSLKAVQRGMQADLCVACRTNPPCPSRSTCCDCVAWPECKNR